MDRGIYVSEAPQKPRLFADCALPPDEVCECGVRGVDDYGGASKCLVPAINATAAELGWTIPYPQAHPWGRP